MPSDERLTIDDLPGMLDYEIVARFDALEAEVARYRERVSFGNHKRAQCEDNLERAEAQLAASEAARAALVEAARGVTSGQQYGYDACMMLELPYRGGSKRMQRLIDALAAQPAAPAPGEGGQ